MLPSAILQQPALIRLMIALGSVILPAVAWVDYQKGHHFSAVVEAVSALTLLALILTIRPLGIERAIKITLFVMFALVALSSVEKLGSMHNFAWFSIMPFLYISIGGLSFGGLLTTAHFVFILGCYLFFQPTLIKAIDPGAWIQVCLAYFTAAGLAVSYEHAQRQLRKRLLSMAEHDPLTGLLNRRGMQKRLHSLAALLTRQDIVVTLAILDIDHFKRVNDEYGHAVGDTVLREISKELQRIFRSSDYLARWGGEEFLVALTRANMTDAKTILERLRRENAELQDLSVPTITLSVGAAEWSPGIDLGTALKQADLALYEAKQKGRNKLVAASDDNRVPNQPGISTPTLA